MDEIRSLSDLGNSLESLGVLTGHAAEGAKVALQWSVSVAEAEANESVSDTERKSVFLQLWDQPLQSIGKDHLLNEVIRRCGGRSITDTIPGLAPLVSMEQVLAEDPALIIVESPLQARHWSSYTQLRAVAQNKLAVINPDLLHRPTLRLLDGMGQICRQLAAL